MKHSFLVRKSPFIFGITVSLFVVVASFGLFVKPSKAILEFGGPITNVFYCPCSWNLAIAVGLPSPGLFMYQPGVTMVYSFYQLFRPGPWVLGTYTPGGSCMQFIPYGCAPMAFPQGTITEVGTSL